MLAWVKDSVLHSLKTMRLTSKADGVGLAGAGIVCGEAYLMERCAATSPTSAQVKSLPLQTNTGSQSSDTQSQQSPMAIHRSAWISI